MALYETLYYEEIINKVYVHRWPEKIKLSRRYINANPDVVEIDANVVDFVVDNGIARYYRVKGIEDADFVYAKKFYAITYKVM